MNIASTEPHTDGIHPITYEHMYTVYMSWLNMPHCLLYVQEAHTGICHDMLHLYVFQGIALFKVFQKLIEALFICINCFPKFTKGFIHWFPQATLINPWEILKKRKMCCTALTRADMQNLILDSESGQKCGS